MNNKSAKKQFGQSPDKPPEYLDKAAKLFWRRWTPALRREGILNEATYELVASMCQAYSVYLDAVQRLRVEGRVITTHTGAVKTNPMLAVEKQAWEQFVRGFKELKIAGEPVASPADELETFLAAPSGNNAEEVIAWCEEAIERAK